MMHCLHPAVRFSKAAGCLWTKVSIYLTFIPLPKISSVRHLAKLQASQAN